MIRVLADQNLYKIQTFLPEEVELQKFDPSSGLPEDWSSYHGLFIRTVTPVNEQLLKDSSDGALTFIGSGSAGFDHVDLNALEQRGITFAHAPGCNARAVAEYVVTALLKWGERNRRELGKLQIGVVGVGNVGSALVKILDNLSLSYRLYDPPRAEKETDFTSVDLNSLLDSDILTFHTPLTTETDYPTYHWLNKNILKSHSFDLIINSARGGVVDEKALLESHENNRVGSFVIDVWDNEPLFSDELARNAFIRTPHIAGYSRQAKLRASRMICASLADHFGLTFPPPLPGSQTEIADMFDESRFQTLTELIDHIHPLDEYQQAIDKLIGLPDNKKSTGFAHIRTNRPYRNEFQYIKIPAYLLDRFPMLRKLNVGRIN